MSMQHHWALTESIPTLAGTVAAGCAGEGPALVLAHGWPWSSYAWHRMIPELAQRYRVFWYDMPGFGRSQTAAEQATSLDVQGEVFAELLAFWQLQSPHVLAHDFGGALTLRAHLLHGCEYERLLLMNVVALRPWGSVFFDHVGRHVDAFQGLPEHIHAAVVEAYIRGALAHDIDERDLAALVAPWLSSQGQGSFYHQFAQADEQFTAVLEPHLHEIRCPVDILWGKDDPWIPLERGQALHKHIPRARFTTLDDVGHLPQLEAPHRVLACLQATWDASTDP